MKSGPGVIERPGDDVEVAVAVDVACRRAPPVVDRRHPLNGEARRELFLRLDDAHQILPGEVLVADLAGAADVERDGAEAGRVRLVHRDELRRDRTSRRP